MPGISFVLPHWLYWSALGLFPLAAMWLLKSARAREARTAASMPIAYFLLVSAGFLGMHRIYLRSLRGLLFIPVFVALLFANAENRASREGVSEAGNQIMRAEFFLEKARKENADDTAARENAVAHARESLAAAESVQNRWRRAVQFCALLILAGLLFDAARIPSLRRRCDQLDRDRPLRRMQSTLPPTASGGKVRAEETAFAKAVGALNQFAGSFVACWSVIAVFVYYYEVIARYVFNSPTNWAHESMFLMFGAQYLLAGGFCLREDAHVRVDVFYMKFSRRKKAMVDAATSLFFFIFVVSLLLSGWTFFSDSFEVREVSFTEWGIQYYPVKFTLALGAALLLLQGIARLLRDITVLIEPAREHGI